jgi:hypothetical protein
MSRHNDPVRILTATLAACALGATGGWSAEPVFQKPTPEEALKFLQSMPRVNRENPPNFVPRFPGERYFVQPWKNCTVQDLKAMKILHPGEHIETAPGSGVFSQRHVRINPSDWKYFTVFEQLEEFNVTHDMENVTDECLFYLGQLPQTMRSIRLEMSEATGDGIKYLQNLKNLKALSLNFSGTIRDVALEHAGGIPSIEYLDVRACPAITGSGVRALSGLKNLKVLKIGSCSLSDSSLTHFTLLPVEELDMSNVEEGWIVKRRGGSQCRFTVTYDGLSRLLASKENLPNLKRLVLRKTAFSKEQKAELAKLKPGLEVL